MRSSAAAKRGRPELSCMGNNSGRSMAQQLFRTAKRRSVSRLTGRGRAFRPFPRAEIEIDCHSRGDNLAFSVTWNGTFKCACGARSKNAYGDLKHRNEPSHEERVMNEPWDDPTRGTIEQQPRRPEAGRDAGSKRNAKIRGNDPEKEKELQMLRLPASATHVPGATAAQMKAGEGCQSRCSHGGEIVPGSTGRSSKPAIVPETARTAPPRQWRQDCLQ